MKRFYVVVVFFVLFSAGAHAAALTTEVLAMRLWNVYDKETNASYEALDNYRLKLDKNDPAKSMLADPQSFKKYQTVLRNRFIDRVSKEFTRKEIINLTTIYKRPEIAKLRLFTMDFWDEKELKNLFGNFDSELPPLPPK